MTQLCTSGSLGCEGLRADAIGMGGFGGFRCDAWLETAAADPYSLRLCVANPKGARPLLGFRVGRVRAAAVGAAAAAAAASADAVRRRPRRPPRQPHRAGGAEAVRRARRATKYVCGSWYTSIGAGVEIATGSPEPENRDFLQLCELRPGSNRCFGVWLLCEGGAPSADSDDGWF